jgi:hypothetical protein
MIFLIVDKFTEMYEGIPVCTRIKLKKNGTLNTDLQMCFSE